MSMLSWNSSSVFEPISWQADVRARLEERHLIAWSSSAETRTRFAASLGRYLSTQPATQICPLHGRAIRGIDDLCDQLERLIPVERLARTIDGPHGVASLLRSREGADTLRSRILLWHDADVVLRRDRSLFGALCEVLSGVSAELEMSEGGSLLEQRCVYVGSEALAEEARRADSVMTTWSPEGGSIPFWALVSGLDRPPMVLCSIDRLTRD